MSEVEQLAREQFKNIFRNRLCEMLSEIEEEYVSTFIQGYAKGETDEKFRTKQVVTNDSAEVIKLRNQVFIARGLLASVCDTLGTLWKNRQGVSK